MEPGTNEEKYKLALEDILGMQVIWNGGIVRPSREQLVSLIEQMRETAREALKDEPPIGNFW